MNAPTQPDTLSPTVHLLDDDEAVRDSLGLLIGTVGLRVQAWNEPQAFLAQFDRDGKTPWGSFTSGRSLASRTRRQESLVSYAFSYFCSICWRSSPVFWRRTIQCLSLDSRCNRRRQHTPSALTSSAVTC